MIRILVVEDESSLNEMLCDFLKSKGFYAEGILRGDLAIARINQSQYDVVLLDIMLPGKNGFAVLKQIQGRALPGVILITARGIESDKLRAFRKGADDYLTKPFSFQELEARLRALLRRLPIDEHGIKSLKYHKICMELTSQQCFYEDEEIELTTAQFRILKEMVRWPGRVFSREALLEILDDQGSDAFDRTIDAHIKNIRKRLGSGSVLIKTVRGSGYKIKAGL